MKKILSVLTLTLFCGALCAQVKIDTPKDNDSTDSEIFTVVETEPEFPGGYQALYQYLGANIKYPEQAKAENISGTVFVRFVVEKDGSISNIKLMRDIGGGCGAEAVRVLSEMPHWNPARQRGKRVRALYQLPIKFTLND